jgi:hypothetical protein
LPWTLFFFFLFFLVAMLRPRRSRTSRAIPLRFRGIIFKIFIVFVHGLAPNESFIQFFFFLFFLGIQFVIPLTLGGLGPDHYTSGREVGRLARPPFKHIPRSHHQTPDTSHHIHSELRKLPAPNRIHPYISSSSRNPNSLDFIRKPFLETTVFDGAFYTGRKRSHPEAV